MPHLRTEADRRANVGLVQSRAAVVLENYSIAVDLPVHPACARI